MNCLVTGGAGFVGTNLIKKLLDEGHNVVSLDNYSSGLKENEVEGCKYYDVDLCEVVDYSFFMDKPDTIFHMAALARIQTSLREPQHHIKNNFVSTLNVLEFARQKECPVVYAGSSSKHHGVTGSPYAWVKWSGEELCKLYSDVYDVPTSICRFYNVYGPHQLIDGPYCTVVGIFQEQYRKGESLTITGDGEQRRDFTHVYDIVDGLYSCMRAMHGEVDMRYAGAEWEFGRGVNHSINELASYFGSNYPTKYISARDGEYDVTLCDDENTREGLDYNPTRNLDDYIRDFVETNE
jgi:UDP-glucose 4-epimerase